MHRLILLAPIAMLCGCIVHARPVAEPAYVAAPAEVWYDGFHPIPGGDYCYISGRHTHAYLPPERYRAQYVWVPGARAYHYRGAYVAPRARPVYVAHPAPVYRAPPPVRPPPPAYRAPAGPRRDPPGRGVPPGHVGAPYTPHAPPSGGPPPGHGGSIPGHGGPPGHHNNPSHGGEDPGPNSPGHDHGHHG